MNLSLYYWILACCNHQWRTAKCIALLSIGKLMADREKQLPPKGTHGEAHTVLHLSAFPLENDKYLAIYIPWVSVVEPWLLDTYNISEQSFCWHSYKHTWLKHLTLWKEVKNNRFRVSFSSWHRPAQKASSRSIYRPLRELKWWNELCCWMIKLYSIVK